MTGMNTTETAQAIRTNLKAQLKLSSKSVSVRKGGGSVRVTVLDKSVDFDAVKKIAESFEKVRRCEASGEILSGGNTFVFVNWEHGLFAEEEAVIIAAIPKEDGEVVEVMGAKINRSKGYILASFDNDIVSSPFPESLARQLAIKLATGCLKTIAALSARGLTQMETLRA